jgi:hypothetical protein
MTSEVFLGNRGLFSGGRQPHPPPQHMEGESPKQDPGQEPERKEIHHMRLLLGPCRCQGCGDPVRYIEPDEGLPGWFWFDIAWEGPIPWTLRRHRCPAGRRPIAARILRPWTASGQAIVFEGRLRLGSGAA